MKNKPKVRKENTMSKEVKNLLKNMYNSLNFDFDESKDLYSNYASQLFNIPYEDCCEYKNNEPNILGKERRLLVKCAVAYLLEH